MRAMIVLLCAAGCQEPRPEPAKPEMQAAPTVDEEVAADIARYVKSLASKNASVCMDAVDYLPYFGRAAVPALVEALKSEDANQRGWGAAALGRIPDARSVPGLIGLLEDKSPLKLFVLSDDGEERFQAYPDDTYTVAQQAQSALVATTGKRLQKKADWDKWWGENGSAFNPGELEPYLEAMAVPAHAKWLKGVKICLDPGHGGDMHKKGYKRGPTYASEAEMNLRVARFLRDFLERAGATVVMTRYSDRDIDLKPRAELAGAMKCDFFLSVHHNWSSGLKATATTTWYHLSQDVKPASVDLARYIQEETIRQMAPGEGPKAGGLMSDGLMYNTGFGVLRALGPEVPGCLVETTYYSNLAMERKLRDIEFNRREAYGMFIGIAKYLYYGVPRAEIVKSGAEGLVLQVYDGLEERREWAKPYRVLSEFIRVRVDGAVVAHEYKADKGQIEVKGPIAAGDHEALVDLINIHKNHSWPKRLKFAVK